MPRIDTLWYDLEARTQNFESGIARSKTALSDFTAYVKANPVAVLAALVASLTAAGTAAVKMGAAFELEMKKVQVVTKGTKEELRALSDGVMQLYKTTPVGSLDELTRSLQDIVGSGIEAGKSLEFLRVATDAAVGGSTSVDVATSALLTMVANYGKMGLSVEQISDKMFRAVDLGRITFEELASSIGAVAPLTAQYDISLDDLLGTLAQLTVNGLTTADAVTAIRSAIVNIISPTGKLAEEAPKLAAAFNADRLRRDGFAKFLIEFSEAAKGSGVEINTLFGDIQGLIGALSALGDGGEGVKQKVDSLTTSTGATTAAVNEMKTAVQNLNTQLGNELRGTISELGESLLPWWNGVLLRIIETIDAKRGAILRLQGAMRSMREFEADQIDPAMLSVARRELDPNAGRSSNKLLELLREKGGQQRDVVLGMANESTQALARLLTEFGRVGTKVFEGMTPPEMERLNGELTKLQQQLPNREDSDAVGALALALRETAASAKVAAAEAERLAAAAEKERQKNLGGGPPKVSAAAKKKAEEEAKAAAAKVKSIREEFENLAFSAGAPDALERLRAQFDKFLEKAKEAKVGTEELKKMAAVFDQLHAAAGQRAADELAAQIGDLMVAATETKVDDLNREIENLRKQFKDAPASAQPQLEALIALKEKTRDSVAAAEDLGKKLADLRDRAELGGLKPLQEMSELLKLRDRETAALERTEAVKERIRQIDERIAELQGETQAAVDSQNGEQNKAREAAANTAQQVVMIARGALAAADAFGLMSESSAKTAEQVINLAEGVGRLIANPADIGAWVQSIGSVASLASGAFGNSARDKEEKEADKANARAVENLNTFAASLEKAISALSGFAGSTYAAVAKVVNYVAEQTEGESGRENVIFPGMDAWLEELGISLADMQEIAKAHRIELTGTVQSYRDLRDAIASTVEGFADFGTSLDERRSWAEMNDNARGLTLDPEQRLDREIDLGGSASAPLGALLGDAFKSGGSDGLRTVIRGIVSDLAPGGEGVDKELLGTMSPEQFRAYVSNLLDVLGMFEESVAPTVLSAAEKLQGALGTLSMQWELLDIDDPAERFAQVTDAIGAMDPALAALADGLDLTTKEGIDKFGEKVAGMAAEVKAGSLVIAGFSADQVIDALTSWESASDAAAAGIAAAAGEVSRLFEDLDVRALRALGDDAGADLLDAQKKGDADLASARTLLAQGYITQADYDKLASVIGLEIANVIKRNAPAEEEGGGGGGSSKSPGQTSVVASAGAQSVDLLIGIGNTELALHRQEVALLTAITRALQVGPMPQLQPPLASAVFAGTGGRNGGAGTTGAGGVSVVVHQQNNFYVPINDAPEMQAAIRRGGSDVEVELQRQLETQRRLEGRAEVM